jgi:hypothetical protein
MICHPCSRGRFLETILKADRLSFRDMDEITRKVEYFSLMLRLSNGIMCRLCAQGTQKYGSQICPRKASPTISVAHRLAYSIAIGGHGRAKPDELQAASASTKPVSCRPRRNAATRGDHAAADSKMHNDPLVRLHRGNAWRRAGDRHDCEASGRGLLPGSRGSSRNWRGRRRSNDK